MAIRAAGAQVSSTISVKAPVPQPTSSHEARAGGASHVLAVPLEVDRGPARALRRVGQTALGALCLEVYYRYNLMCR